MRFADIGRVDSVLQGIKPSVGLDTSIAEGNTAANVREMYKNGEIDEQQYVELMETLASRADSQTTAL